MTKTVFVYCRVSTYDQQTDLQKTDIINYVKFRNWKIDKIFEEKASGVNTSRPKFLEMMNQIRKGKANVLIIWRLDRLGRNLKHLITTIHELSELGVELISLSENLDMSTSTGRLMLGIICSFCQFERDTIIERTRAGIHQARLNGKRLGRPPKKFPITKIVKLRREGLSLRKIGEQLKMSQASVHRILKVYQKTLK